MAIGLEDIVRQTPLLSAAIDPQKPVEPDHVLGLEMTRQTLETVRIEVERICDLYGFDAAIALDILRRTLRIAELEIEGSLQPERLREELEAVRAQNSPVSMISPP